MSMGQIIPIPDAEEFVISMSSKQQEEAQTKTVMKNRDKVRRAFWAKYLPVANEKSTLFQNINPMSAHWLSA